MQQKLLSCLIFIMVLAQIGLAQHNSVHVIDYHHEVSQEHHDDNNNPNDNCQTYHFASSLHGLDGNNALNFSFNIHKIISFYDDVLYAQNLAFNYRSRAPPSFLI